MCVHVSLFVALQTRRLVCNEIREEVAKINDKFKETQTTLVLILAKLINPNTVQVDGFAPPPIITVAHSGNEVHGI